MNSRMPFLFTVLSAAYIAAIFLLADSPVVSDMAPFNPYSLLHIPLYGILTLLLILSFPASKKGVLNPTNSSNPRNLVVAGIIALVVAITDEIYQAYLPNRDGSITDVLLDAVGIIVCVLVLKRIRSISWLSKRAGCLRPKT